MAKIIFQEFIKQNKTKLYLDVKKDNIRAINFYKKNKFIELQNKFFGKTKIPGIIMVRN